MDNLLSILLAVFLLVGIPAGKPASTGSSTPLSPSPASGVDYDNFDPIQELPPASHLPYRDLSVLKGRTIVVDAGHGGDNPGARGASGATEANNVLAIARFLQAELEKVGARVIMTRTGDEAPLGGRVDQLAARTLIANRSRADVFVSIHNDSNPDPNKSGPTTYYYGSESLARAIQGELVTALGAPDNGVMRRGFYVLKHTRMPAVLVEAGFITNPYDDLRLRHPVYQRRVAQGIVRGLARYFGG
ncbi:MAG: N-acetylmuramoyl-L-alanine amidase [Limnochordales bacterium]|nr:N-acetylmuramoyl-L-alanine amidase [Limnochordales bacterium]